MPVTFSFGGAGRHFPFMLGVAHGLRTHLDVNWNEIYVHCISSGISGAMALMLCTPVQIEYLLLRGIEAAHTANIEPLQAYYLNIIESMLPSNAYQMVGDRLIIGQTKLPFFQPELVQGPFHSQEQLLSEIYSSCRIPFLTGTLASEVDGGFSHQYAVFDADTVVVTLKRKSRSDVYTQHISFFGEMLLPTRQRMLDLFELGKRTVEAQLPLIRDRIARSEQVRLYAQGEQLVLYTGKE